MMYSRKKRRERDQREFRPGIAERLSLPYMDGGLAFAAIGLALASILVLGQTTQHDVPGDPGYYSDSHTIYAVLGIAGMYALARVDYSRFRELRVGIYTSLCISISMVFVFGFAARGPRRGVGFLLL